MNFSVFYKLFEENQKQNVALGMVGYATEDGIAYIKAYDGSEDHQLLLSPRTTPLGINPLKVKHNIKNRLDSDFGMGTDEIAGWRYINKTKELYFWYSDLTDSMLKDYVEHFITQKLKLPVVKVKNIGHGDASHQTAHFKQYS